MSEIVSKSEKKTRLNDVDLDKELLIPSSQYIDLIQAKKSPSAPNTKKRKIFNIVLGVVSGLSLAAGATMLGISLSQPIKYFTITFDGNGGEISGASTQKIEKNTIFKNINKPIATKANSTFAGWCLDEKGEKPVEDTFTFTDNITLYASYVSSPSISTITFDPVLGQLEGMQYSFAPSGSPFSLFNKPIATKEKHTFAGWYYQTGPQAGQPVLDKDIITGDIVVEAHYSAGETLTLNFKPTAADERFYGNTTVAIESGMPFGTINCPTVYKPGFVAYGWYYIVEDTTICLLDENSIITENHDLYPYWVGTTLLHFQLNGGTMIHGYEYQYALWLPNEDSHFLQDVSLPTITKASIPATKWEKLINGNWEELTSDNDILNNSDSTWEVRPIWD